MRILSIPNVKSVTPQPKQKLYGNFFYETA